MANNCLVTKLKGVVNNDNLPTLGSIIVTVKHLENPGVEFPSYFLQHITDGVTIKTKDGLAHLSLSRELTDMRSEIHVNNSYVPIYFEDPGYDYKVEISNKYSQKAIHWQLIGLPLSMDVANIMYLNDDTDNSINLKLYYSSCYGDITPLADHVGQKNFTSYASDITINIDEFVRRRIAKGVATYSATDVYINCYNVYFGNKNNFLSSGHIIWESQQKIAIIDDDPNNKTVFERGYSAEEIAIWQAEGRTVTDVMSGTVYPPTNN